MRKVRVFKNAEEEYIGKFHGFSLSEGVNGSFVVGIVEKLDGKVDLVYPSYFQFLTQEPLDHTEDIEFINEGRE